MSFDFSEVAHGALDSTDPALILGGPGSGKTTLSLFKAQRLIRTLAPAQEVLFLSFSRAAVHQVVVRCKGVLTSDERQLITVRTYHAFCMEVLQTHGRLLTGRQPRIMTPREERLRKSTYDGEWAGEQVRLADEEAVYTFDLFARCTADLLSRAACIRKLLADKYPVIILDEFQDTNDSQWELVQQLSRDSRLIVLADPDQRIFEYDPSVDPERLNQLRTVIAPTEYDLGAANHRSPGGGILSYADAVLCNRPLPSVSEVSTGSFWPNAMDATVHASVVWLLSALIKSGTARPTVAVLCRTNGLVSRLSDALSSQHAYNGTLYQPVDHSVMWDAELAAAAAAVVASILEWPPETGDERALATLNAIADFYDIKNGEYATKSARDAAKRFRNAIDQVRAGKTPRVKAAQAIVAASATSFDLSGNPIDDWKAARQILAGCPNLEEIHKHSRFVRLFRASGEIGPVLADRWSATGAYGQAREMVQRAIDQARLLTAQADPHGVTLMTMHKAKGKEFDGVLLVEGPYVGQFLSEDKEAPPYLASRRLLRVAITRARSRVVLLRPNGALPLVGTYA